MSNKRFKLRFSFQFCGSKHHSTTQAIYKLSSAFNPKTLDITYCNFPNPPPSTPTHPSIDRQVSLNTVSNGCGYSPCITESPSYTWMRSTDEKPRRKVYRPSMEYGDTDDDISVTPLLKPKNQRNAKTKKSAKKIKFRTSTSSDDSGWFTSEEISSRSFSNDQFNRKNNAKKISSRSFSNDSANNDRSEDRKLNSSPVNMTSGLRRMMCKARGIVAVEKKSEDPYEDFRRSMMEMIMEKQLFEVQELEQLLRCFLELNSRHHHGVIVEAFSDIWVALFCKTSV